MHAKLTGSDSEYQAKMFWLGTSSTLFRQCMSSTYSPAVQIDYPVYDHQGDAPDDAGTQNDDHCPPYPTEASPRACRARPCKTDKDCHKGNQRCCFNGCMLTCTAEMTQPAVVDWQKEPRRQGLSGTSWLIKGPEETDDVEPCTTTRDPDDGDPLLCPHGYVCHITDPGDPELGVPNRGQCLQEEQEQRTSWVIEGPEDIGDVEPCTTTKDPDDGDPLLCPHGYVCHITDPGDPELGVPNRGQCMKETQDQGTSWLIKDSKETDDVEPCTTTKDPDDGDPLLCPHGYVCHITDPGDPELGVPNRGQCIKEKQEKEYKSRRKILKSDLRKSGKCLLGATIIRDQTIILLGDEKEKCKCHKGTIQCGDEFLFPDVIR
ncbi:uncharacterized protein LOC135475056 isoform X2 [Liolophura sinensis]|uniref:uncharacterized protein LOC135475056 isoform X2 n=1 Tax=Liolophura sinensis TaxID=3198878 RepID=UPI003158D487